MNFLSIPLLIAQRYFFHITVDQLVLLQGERIKTRVCNIKVNFSTKKGVLIRKDFYTKGGDVTTREARYIQGGVTTERTVKKIGRVYKSTTKDEGVSSSLV